MTAPCGYPTGTRRKEAEANASRKTAVRIEPLCEFASQKMRRKRVGRLGERIARARGSAPSFVERGSGQSGAVGRLEWPSRVW
jgi:hypothetical protein